jgi:hypothetical protein
MLNHELARILVAERLWLTDQHVRQGRLRRDLAEGQAASRAALDTSVVRPCPEPGQRAKPALG